ncbi:hypothetical protein SAMN03159496_06270 [Rhizobium sp. NFR07]|nr:hypothetical protein SAMN03159496_06270 [Rhizobium sp. NFR07]
MSASKLLAARVRSAKEALSVLALKIGAELDRTNAEARGQFKELDDLRVAPPAFKTADLLMAETGPVSDLLLRQTFCLTEARKVPAYQPARIHARSSQRTGGESMNYDM